MTAPVHFDEKHSDPRFLLHGTEDSASWEATPGKPADLQKVYFGTRRLWGSEGFTTGTHYWEVQVERDSAWFVGVSVGSYRSTSWLKSSPSNGLWLIMMWTLGKDHYPLRTLGNIIKIVHLLKVGVLLDFDNGKVTFFNPDDDAILHTLTGNFTERLYPFFRYCLSETKGSKITII
ncbi:zinc-binding protein A33-like [Cetorhinus maximus]